MTPEKRYRSIVRWPDGAFRIRLLRLRAEQRITSWAEAGRRLGCDPRTAASHTNMLTGMGLLKQIYDAPTRTWAYEATDYGRDVLAVALTEEDS